MLRRTPSLALRAGLIFMSIYTLIFIAVMSVAVHFSGGDNGSDRHRGANAAVKFAANELRERDGSLELPTDGNFGRLSSENPSLWLVARRGERTISFGRVPKTAARLFDQSARLVDSARFEIPEIKGRLGAATMRRYDDGAEPFVIAAGGVDPASLTARDSLRLFGPEDALMAVLTIAFLGFLPMLVALPFFARAIRPIAAEAATLRDRKSVV